MAFNHRSVLLDETITNLNIRADGIYLDGTIGGGGHALAIAARLSAAGRLIGIDRDADALSEARTVLADYADRVTFARANFAAFDTVLDGLDLAAADGILLDLGVSSYQLDEPGRGFSYHADAPLDMRMDNRQAQSAFDVVNGYSERDLCRVISDYGEERWAKRIAAFIVSERADRPIQTTLALVGVIKKAVPKGARQEGIHPAKRTFQAIRIEVNQELEILENTVERMAARLNPRGRLCIISFHSLEDRIIKNTFRRLEQPCVCPRDFPVCVCGKKPVGRVLTRKPILPSSDEQTENHRARSAKLRVFEKS